MNTGKVRVLFFALLCVFGITIGMNEKVPRVYIFNLIKNESKERQAINMIISKKERNKIVEMHVVIPYGKKVTLGQMSKLVNLQFPPNLIGGNLFSNPKNFVMKPQEVVPSESDLYIILDGSPENYDIKGSDKDPRVKKKPQSQTKSSITETGLLPEVQDIIATKELHVLLDEAAAPDPYKELSLIPMLDLVKCGANPNEKNFKGETILFYVVKSDKEKKNLSPIIAALVDKGLNINAQDAEGNTVGHQLIDSLVHNMLFIGGEDTSIPVDNILQILVGFGLDVTIKNNDGKNMFEYARNYITEWEQKGQIKGLASDDRLLESVGPNMFRIFYSKYIRNLEQRFLKK